MAGIITKARRSKKIKKSNVLRKLFGAHKFSKSVKQLMKETDKELYNE